MRGVRRDRRAHRSRERSRPPARPPMRRTPGEIAALIAQAQDANARVKQAKAAIAEAQRRRREQDHEQTSRWAAVDEIALRALADGMDRLDVIAKLGSIMSSTAALGAEFYLRRDVEAIARRHYHGETRPPHADDRRWPGSTRRDRQQARDAAIERAIAEWRDPRRREALYDRIEHVVAVNQDIAPVAPPQSPPRTTDAERDEAARARAPHEAAGTPRPAPWEPSTPTPPHPAGTPAPAPWKGQRHEIRRTRLARAARSRPHPVEVQLRARGRRGLASRRRLLLPGAALVLPAPREWRPP